MSALKKKDLFIKGVRIDWDNIERYSYLRNIRTIAGINSLTFHSPITFFVGENGSGKSTLLEAMAVAYGYYLRAESFYNVATMEEQYSAGSWNPLHLHQKSHGESFLTTINEYFKSNGLFFLDEPEAALSPQRQMTLLLKIAETVKKNSPFFIVTHSPVLLTLPGAEILSFDNGNLHKIKYEDTESYRITEMFINHREQILKRLLEY